MRRVAISACVGCLAVSVGGCIALLPLAFGQATHQASRCGTYRFEGQQYGVYIPTGKVKCSTATAILRAVAGGAGRFVNRGGSANSYTVYGGWLCPVSP